MALFQSGNPTLKESAFRGTILEGIQTSEEMTIRGTMNKFIILFVLMLSTTVFSWSYFYQGNNPLPLMLVGVFGGLVISLIMAFRKQSSPYLAPAFALLEGLFVGSVSAYYDYAYGQKYPGLVMQAVGLTLVVALVMFVLYQTRIIRVTEKFRSVITIATISIMVFYLIRWIASLAFHTEMVHLPMPRHRLVLASPY